MARESRMITSSWRARAAPIIARVLKEHAGADERTIRCALREAYPFGERAMHPYKIWLDEIARQRGRRPRVGSRPARVADERLQLRLEAVRRGEW